MTLRPSVEIDPSTDAARAGIPDAAPTVEADTPTRAGIGVEDATLFHVFSLSLENLHECALLDICA